MKSPWQFISDLAGRRRQRLAEQSSEPIAKEGPDRLLLPAPSDRPGDGVTTTNADNQPGQLTRPPEEALQEETQFSAKASPAEAVGYSQEGDGTTSVTPDTSNAIQAQSAPKTKGRVPRSARPRSRHKPDVTQAAGSMPDQMPVARTFHDDVRSVDDNIKRLRAELAAELRVQNEQLEKMLERFDRQ